jgi:hypothetical protein
MRRNFLRPPGTPGEYAADLVRVLGLVSVLAVAVWGTPTHVGVLALSLPALLVPRFLGVRAWFDIFYGITVLVAAWSNVLDLYTTVVGWDLLIHFVCTGVIAVVAYLGLADLRVAAPPRAPDTPRRAPVVLAVVLGLAVSAVWEMVEWVGWAFITDDIFVAYSDTIGDMAVGGLGAVCAGVLLASASLREPEASRERRPSARSIAT